MALNRDDFENSLGYTDNLSGKTESKGFYEDVYEDVYDDIVARLPKDRFGMKIRAAVTGWFQDFRMFDIQEDEGKKIADGQYVFKGWVWNCPGGFKHEEESISDCYGISSSSENVYKIIGDQSSSFRGLNWDWDSFEINNTSDSDHGGSLNGGGICNDGEAGDPSDALFLVLGHLDVKDFLAVERVCRSLRDAVRSDSLLWRSVHIEHSLSTKITDDALLKLTNRAQGTLECLSLIGCIKITDDGLKRVLESNPELTKLILPECTGLSIEGILSNLKAFRSVGSSGIKHLRIGGCFDVTKEQFKELKFLLGVDNSIQSREQKPQSFGHQGQLLFMSDDDRVIDIEICPICEKLNLVYDCLSESCRRTHQLCRACFFFIERCSRCGRCLKHCRFEQAFTLELICFDCIKHGGKKKEVICPWYKFYFCG